MMLHFRKLVLPLSVICILLSAVEGRSRQDIIDSLDQIIHSDVVDTVKFYPYTQVIWHYQHSNKPYALELTHELKDLALRHQNESWLNNAYYYYGVIYKNAGEYEKARLYMDSSFTIATSRSDTARITYASFQLGVIASMQHQYEDAINHLNRAERLYSALGMPSSVAMTLSSKGSVYRKLQLYHKALESYFESLSIHEEQRDSAGLANVYNNIANIYASEDSVDLAFSYYDKQEAINEAIGNTYGLSFVYENRGRLYHKIGEYDQAIASLEKAANIRMDMGSKDYYVAAILQLGGSYLKKNQLDKAYQYIKKSYDTAVEYDLAFRLQQSHEMMAKVSAAMGNYETAYFHNLEYQSMKDSLLNEQISEQALRIDALTDQEMVRRDQEIALLSTQNELKDLQIRSRNRFLFVTLFALVALGVLSFVIYQSRQKVRTLNEALSEKQAVIAKSLSEKEFLLKEIHHRVKNNLQIISSLLKLQSRSVADQKAQQALDEGRNRVRSMALIHQNLYQDEGNISGIKVEKYLRELVDELVAAYAVKNEIDLELNIEDMVLDVDELVPIGLIINELVTNTLKYAFPGTGGGKIMIHMNTTPANMIRLEVSDNGKGYGDNEGASGFGQRLVRSLAAQLDATYEIEHEDGVRITFMIPSLRQVA